jgi:hypothetical protein
MCLETNDEATPGWKPRGSTSPRRDVAACHVNVTAPEFQMSVFVRGNVLKAYPEVDPSIQIYDRICLFLGGAGWIEFTGVTLNDGFVLPSPLGCECIVSDISDGHWSIADYEIVSASSYSHEGVFYAKCVKEVEAI